MVNWFRRGSTGARDSKSICGRRNLVQVAAASAAALARLTPATAAPPLRRSWEINVKDFGAKADGKADDSSAINAALAEMRVRSARTGHFGLGCRLIFPSGQYCLRKSLNLTLLRGINTVIEGEGSVLLGQCVGMPVVDALGSRWLTIKDLTVIGDPDDTPSVGIQVGRLSDDVTDDHRLVNVKLLGHYEVTCFYNRGSETCVFDHLLLWNDRPSGYCIIQDGLNHFGILSTFATSTLPTDSNLSFNENLFISCDFRHGSGGIPIWLGDTARHAFLRCYASTSRGPTFLVYSGRNGHKMLDVDCHCETAGLQDVFQFAGERDHIIVRGFRFTEHECFAARSIFSSTDMRSTIELQQAHIQIASYRRHECKVFDNPDRWQVSGTYEGPEGSSFNSKNGFKGIITLGLEVQLLGVTIRL